MKLVSFEIAKALKEAGYPQDYIEYYYDYNECMQKRDRCYVNCQCVAPTYIDVWFWLWREKKIAIGCAYKETYKHWCANANINAGNDEDLIIRKYSSGSCNDPEEAIIAAIQYIVEHQLLK